MSEKVKGMLEDFIKMFDDPNDQLEFLKEMKKQKSSKDADIIQQMIETLEYCMITDKKQ